MIMSRVQTNINIFFFTFAFTSQNDVIHVLLAYFCDICCCIFQGFTAHIISTISEWVTALFFLFFFFTYIRDFQKVKVEVQAKMTVRHLDEEPLYGPNETSPLLA